MAGDNRGSELATVVIILLIFCLLTVSMRCYTVLCILKKRFYSEDWLAVVTLVSQISFNHSKLRANIHLLVALPCLLSLRAYFN